MQAIPIQITGVERVAIEHDKFHARKSTDGVSVAQPRFFIQRHRWPVLALASVMPRRDNKGLTLIELLVVLAIIGLLSAILLPTLARAKQRTVRIHCVNKQRQIGHALRGFATDHNDRLPWWLHDSDGIDLWASIFGASHTGNDHSWDVRFVFLAPQIRSDLIDARALLSPCDPAAKIYNDAEIRQGRYKGFGAAWDGAHFHLDNRALSYAMHLGGDVTQPLSILTTTRNFVGDASFPFEYPSGVQSPYLKNLLGCSLRADRLTQIRYPFVGSGESNNIVRANHAMATLSAGEGQVLLSDGSAWQADDTALERMIRGHAGRAGQFADAPNENLSRPSQQPAPPPPAGAPPPPP